MQYAFAVINIVYAGQRRMSSVLSIASLKGRSTSREKAGKGQKDRPNKESEVDAQRKPSRRMSVE